MLTIDVSYTQISVFDPDLQAPFNDWTDDHVAQGFAWRPGSVSFGTLRSAGLMAVVVSTSKGFDEQSSRATRVISVPFTVPEAGAVEVASIGSSVIAEIPPGEYELTFEHGLDDHGAMWANFYFKLIQAPVVAMIRRADPELVPPHRLVMTANPA